MAAIIVALTEYRIPRRSDELSVKNQLLSSVSSSFCTWVQGRLRSEIREPLRRDSRMFAGMQVADGAAADDDPSAAQPISPAQDKPSSFSFIHSSGSASPVPQPQQPSSFGFLNAVDSGMVPPTQPAALSSGDDRAGRAILLVAM